MGIRDDARERTRAAIMAAAWRQLAAEGADALSLRAVAREVGLVSSAVYRYVPSREALLTAMIVEAYGQLAAVLDAVPVAPAEGRWSALAHAFREWARRCPHEFQLVYGTPVPGYVAPPETVPAAAAVAAPFLAAVVTPVPAFEAPDLVRQLAASGAPGAQAPAAFAAVLAELAALVGFVGLELAGHYVGSADPADLLFAALVRRQEATLGLRASLVTADGSQR